MSDQADGLRQLVQARSGTSALAEPPAILPKASPRARSLVLTSGKGGVGTSNLALNLAIALGERGGRVVLVDADLGLANIDLLCGLAPSCDLGDVLSGDRTLSEAIIAGPADVRDHPRRPCVEDPGRGPRRRAEAPGRGTFGAGVGGRLPGHRRRFGPGPVDRHAGGGGRRGPGRDHARAHLGGRRSCSDQPFPPPGLAADPPGGGQPGGLEPGGRRGPRSPDGLEPAVLRGGGGRPGLGSGPTLTSRWPSGPVGRSRPPIPRPPPLATSAGWHGSCSNAIEGRAGRGVLVSSPPWRHAGRWAGWPDETGSAG